MCLSENATVKAEVRRTINNGFFTHHPFKYNSGQLEDKGLAYLKILTQKSDTDNFEKYEKMYWNKYLSLETDRNYEGEIISLMYKLN